MNDQVCVACVNRPTRDVHTICEQCEWEVRQALEQLPDLIAELEITMGRLGRRSSRNGKRNRPGMIHYDLYPAQLRDKAINVIQRWVVEIHNTGRQTSLLVGAWTAPDWFRPMCQLLISQLDLIAKRDDADRIHRDITEIKAKITRAIDRPPDLIYAGSCRARITTDDGHLYECDQSIYASPGAALAACGSCGTKHDVRQRRDRMLDSINDRLLTASEAARLITYLGDLNLGRTRTRKLINQWHRRGRLTPRGRTRQDDPRFLFGEVLGLLTRWHQRH